MQKHRDYMVRFLIRVVPIKGIGYLNRLLELKVISSEEYGAVKLKLNM